MFRTVVTFSGKVWVFTAICLLTGISAFGQTVPFEDGLGDGTAKFGLRLGFGPAQVPPSDPQATAVGLAFFTQGFNAFGKLLPMNIVGTNPGLGAGTTTVPTVIVPLKIVFANGNPTLDGTNVVSLVDNSPIFLSVDYTTGGTDLGVTQYGDAIQRGEFWNYPGFSPGGYHVLLGTPLIAPTITITVPVGLGRSAVNIKGTTVGRVDLNFFNNQLAVLHAAYTADELPVFVTDNVFLAQGTNQNSCCILGFHNSESGPIATARTWIYNAYTEAGTFVGDVILDVQPLSHEVAEWLNDPFVGTPLKGGVNLIPPAVLPGQGGACIINFETGDPLEAPPIVFTQTTNMTLYHLQDEAFLSWYLHGASFSVNGFYTFLGTFPTFSKLCGPG